MRDLLLLLRWTLVVMRRRAWLARRDHRDGTFLLYSALAALGDAFAISIAVGLVLTVIAIGAWDAALVIALVAAILIAPRPLAHGVAVPRGWWRVAYWLVQIDELGRAGSDLTARLAAARAAARVGSPPAASAWLADGRRARLDATEVAVQAILAHGRGERDDARGLFLTIAAFAEPAPEAREIAAEWLAVDDAARGGWATLVARGAERARPSRGAHRRPSVIRAGVDADAVAGEPLWPATSLTYLLEGVGARLLGHADAPSAANLWLRWLEAPARRHTRALVQRAIAARPSSAAPAAATSVTSTTTSTPAASPPADTPVARADTTALAAALRAHARALRAGTVEATAAAAIAWDATIATSGLAVAVARRAIELGAPVDAGDRALAALDDQVVGELAALVERRALPLPALHARAPGSPLLAAVAGRARRDMLARLELTCDRIGDRTHAERSIDPIDELRTFVAVRRAYDDAAAQGGVELERLAFPHVHGELSSWTVWLWNERSQHLLSHLITTWLFERALAVGDAEAIELHGANGAIPVPGV